MRSAASWSRCSSRWSVGDYGTPCRRTTLSIDPEDLAQFGDVSQALGAYYDDAIARIASAPSGAADLALERGVRDWFGHRLVTPTGTRGQVLRGIDASEGLPNGVIETLLNTHLIRGEKRAGATWYELAHDRLIQPVIDSNRVWLEGHLQPFQRRAARWVEQGRPANGGEQVLRGRELKEALRFQRAHPVLVNEDESRLIGLSRAARRMRHLTQGVLSFIVLLILVFGVIAWWLKTQAEEKEREAWYQVAVGHWKDAVSARDRDPLTAAHHFAQAAERFAWARRPTESANALLALKFVNDRPLIQAVLSLMSSIHGAACSADGKRILAWGGYYNGKQDTARLWDSASGAPLTPLLKHEDWFRGAQFSRDQSRILTWSQDGTARLWDSASGAALTPPLRHEGTVWGARFSPDGSRILTWSDDGTARLWDGASGAALTPPLRHEGSVRGAQFSPDESRILTWSDDGTARLWESTTGAALTPRLSIRGPGLGRPVQPGRVPHPHLERRRHRPALGQRERRGPDPAAQARGRGLGRPVQPGRVPHPLPGATMAPPDSGTAPAGRRWPRRSSTRAGSRAPSSARTGPAS